MAELLAFGTFHVDRPKKVENELGEITEGVDVLFVEIPRTKQDDNNKLDLLIRNPMMLIAGVFLNFFWSLFGIVLTGTWRSVDAHAVDIVSVKHDIDVEPVDMNIVNHACDVSLLRTIFSWLVFVSSISLLVYGAASASISLTLLGVIFGFAPASIFARRTLSERDRQMCENISEILTSDDDIDIGCLICGNGHIDGITDRLVESEITVSKVHKSKFLRRSL